MASGRIDAYVSTLVSLSEFTKTTEGFEILPFRSDRWSTEYTAAAFRKEDNDLREAFDTAIREMKADGTLAALQEKWFGRSFVDGLSDDAPTW
jgi:polar amino acid transport system substrate-binding protein